MVEKSFENGVKKIKSSDLKIYKFENSEWVFDDDLDSVVLKVVENYIEQDNLKLIVDDYDDEFVIGRLSVDGKPVGRRIKFLPNGDLLARGGFSIFAKNLEFNFDDNVLWDVCYENTSGSKTYLYSERKVELEHDKKAHLVDRFSAVYDNILKMSEKDLKKEKSVDYLALYTLLNTFIRVGNLEYFNHLGHKGLTTLQKKDLDVLRGGRVVFDFIAKDGVPQVIEKKFPKFYVDILKERLEEISDDDFVFANENGHPLYSHNFSDILYRYTGEHFYPHIVRSYFADSSCLNFLEENCGEDCEISKKEVLEKFDEIALALGHKKYNKKKDEWKVSHAVTLKNYIRPEYVKRMEGLYK